MSTGPNNNRSAATASIFSSSTMLQLLYSRNGNFLQCNNNNKRHQKTYINPLAHEIHFSTYLISLLSLATIFEIGSSVFKWLILFRRKWWWRKRMRGKEIEICSFENCSSGSSILRRICKQPRSHYNER